MSMVAILERMLVMIMVCGSILALAGLYISFFVMDAGDESTPPGEQPASDAVNGTQNDSHQK